MRRGRREVQELLRKRRDELVDDRLHRDQGGGPPLLVHHGDMPVGTAMHLVEGIHEGIVQMQTLRVRLHDLSQRDVVDIERRGGHFGDHIALSEHSDQLAVLHNEHTAELFLPHELDSVPHGRVVPQRHGGGQGGQQLPDRPLQHREGDQARLALDSLLPNLLFFCLGLFPHCLHTRIRSGRGRVYRLHWDRGITLPRVTYWGARR